MEPHAMTEPTKPNVFNDTICAISTPPGVGGIAVARISGPDAIAIVDTLWHGKPLSLAQSHTVHLGDIVDPHAGPDEPPLDQALATVYRAPRSFTGEDVVEISVHGSRYIQRQLLQLLTRQGCRMAQAGEFSRRAFTSGRMDLAQAEAVADIIASNSRAQHRLAATQMRGSISRRLQQLRNRLVDLTALLELELDFSEEDVEFADRHQLLDTATEIATEISRLHKSFSTGQAIKEGIPVAIVGATNAGKSTLLNALIGDDRAIVSDIHGTTRDTIEELIELPPYTFRLIDTAGLRPTDDPIEQQGIQRSRQAISKAHIIIAVIDPTSPLDTTIVDEVSQLKAPDTHIVVAQNKSDLVDTSQSVDLKPFRNIVNNPDFDIVRLSALTTQGIDQLTSRLTQIASMMTGDATDDGVIVNNARHADALDRASRSIHAVIDGLRAPLPGDLIAQDLRATIAHLADITGSIPSTEILHSIFSRFCIGK